MPNTRLDSYKVVFLLYLPAAVEKNVRAYSHACCEDNYRAALSNTYVAFATGQAGL